MSNRIYKDFDLPTKHLVGEQHFLPPKTRLEDEENHRRSQPSGTLILESQHTGIRMAAAILRELRRPEDITFSADVLAASGLNTAFYLFGREAPVQRRRLKLEVLATEDPEQRPSTFMLVQNARDDLNRGEAESTTLLDAHRGSWPEANKHKKILGRTIGHAALTLSCAALGDKIGYEETYITDFDIQDLARQRGLSALEHARAMATEIGTPPSLAQFADKDSDLSVYWRRNAPDGALHAYNLAAGDIINFQD
jgi:hypothetical protein